jgi:modulator of FtsH protease
MSIDCLKNLKNFLFVYKLLSFFLIFCYIKPIYNAVVSLYLLFRYRIHFKITYKEYIMGLYDRDYARENAATYGGAAKSDTQIVSFVKETYKLFAASMMAGAVGAYVGVPMAGIIAANFFPLFILEIGLLIGLHFVKHKPGINLMVMFGFVFMTGLMLAPILARTLGMSGGGTIVGNAFAMTSLIFGAMSFYAIKTTKDFSGYGKPLMIALVVIIVFSVINIFMGSPLISILLSGAIVILFSILVTYDTQNIIKGAYETPIDGAIALYLDFLNIFTALLHLFGIFGSDE